MLAPIFSRPRGWLTMYLSSGISPLPFSKRARFDAATWRGRRWPAYDLNGEVAWNEWAVKHGIITDTHIAAEAGEDRTANLAQVRQEMKDEEGTPIANRFLGQTAVANGAPTHDGANAKAAGAKDAVTGKAAADPVAGEADVDVINQLSAGMISETSAVELLVAVGLKREDAEKMVAAEKAKPKPKAPPPAPAAPAKGVTP